MSKGFVDNFSSNAKEYSFSRPTYPMALFTYLSRIVRQNDLAWDCATGNGQAAIELCKYFKRVIASDASESQIQQQFKRENIDYKVFPAEETPIDNDSVDLVTVAMGVHWFDFDRFYSEVKRVGKKGAIIAVWSYGMHKINPEIDKISGRLDFGGDILGKFWSPQIRYIKECYKTIPFPFEEIGGIPTFKMEVRWNLYQLFNYLHTWSAVKKYTVEKKSDPIDMVRDEMQRLWEDAEKERPIIWNLSTRIGIIK